MREGRKTTGSRPTDQHHGDCHQSGNVIDKKREAKLAYIRRQLDTKQGAIAKWLRRQIRNLFLFEGAGSNPAGVELFVP